MIMTAGVLVGCKQDPACIANGDCHYSTTDSSAGGLACDNSDCAVVKLSSSNSRGEAKCDC
jgi:hypothetical protein